MPRQELRQPSSSPAQQAQGAPHVPLRAPQDDQLIGLAEVSRRAGVSKRTVYNLIARGTFPKPVKVEQMSRWFVSEVQGWLDALKAARDRESAA